MNANGRIIYRGISRLDGRTPIVVVVTGLTGSSANRKTGGMLQTWILADDGIEPHTAVKELKDGAICGDCPFSGGKGCYVTVFQAPLGVYRAVQRGSYSHASPSEIPYLANGRPVRIGSYGDPAAVPTRVWRLLTGSASTWTGYTHQWRNPDNADLARFCMASVETPEDTARAHNAGWRTFRVAANTLCLPHVEVLCPASVEAGQRTTCDKCGLCKGSARIARSIVIVAHGNKTKKVKKALLAINS